MIPRGLQCLYNCRFQGANLKGGSRHAAREYHGKSLTSFNQFQKNLKMYLLTLDLPSTRDAVMKRTRISKQKYAEYTDAFKSAVLNIPPNQFNTKHAPPYNSYLRHKPTLPHLGILRHLIENREKPDVLIKQCYENYVMQREGILSNGISLDSSRAFANMTHPEEWYPIARGMKRKWIFHVGPTNSGKTFHALQRLMTVTSGLFAGPLRLLTREVYERLNAAGKPCNLVTGEEIVDVLDDRGNRATISASTVEMVNFQTDLEVAVIDEIQMISDPERGWAWTAAILGLRAKELHLCGEERAVKVLSRIARTLGDEVEVKNYKRLSPLKIEKEPNAKWQTLRKNDAVIVFSRVDIHKVKRQIEASTKFKCVVIYGALPPETRAQQAQRFNDPNSGYDILVASDAIGMGLNLGIKRVIFNTTSKFNGQEVIQLQPSEVRQIAGRAGRFRSSRENITEAENVDDKIGLVTATKHNSLRYIQHCMALNPTPIPYAGLMPPDSLIEKFAADYPPDMSFMNLMEKFYALAFATENYTTCSLLEQIRTASHLSEVDGLLLAEKVKTVTAPIRMKADGMATLLKDLCRAIAEGTPISLADVEMFRPLQNGKINAELDKLEALNFGVTLYLWLSYRFPYILFDREGANEFGEFLRARIDNALHTI